MGDYLEAEQRDDVFILKVNMTEIDLANVAEVRKEYSKLEDTNPKFAIIDLQDVTFIDSSAIGWVISIHQQYKKKNCKLCIVSSRKELKEVFALTYIDKLIDIFDSIDEALASR